MDRLACVDLVALPLQLLLQRQPEWQNHGLPVAVVDEDRPQGTILWVNEAARRCKVHPGLRYAQGLSLASELRAATVSEEEIRSAVISLTQRLRRYSPRVEPSEQEPGLFWIDATGLERLHPSDQGGLSPWARAIVQDLRKVGYLAIAVAVGFSRFGTYALTRSSRVNPNDLLVCDTPAQEWALTREVPLCRLQLDPALREALEQLGVETVEHLVRLPSSGLLERFGQAARQLHGLASGSLWDPLCPEPESPPPSAQIDLDHPEADLTRLLFLLKQALDRLLCTLVDRRELLTELQLRLHLEARPPLEARVRPATPTLDGVQILDLVRLRLESASLTSSVKAIDLRAAVVPANADQLQLFARQPKRDLTAANRALARLRAELGEGAVVRAVLHEGHLPEATFSFEPFEELGCFIPECPGGAQGPELREPGVAQGDPVRQGACRRLVRRVLSMPERLSTDRRRQIPRSTVGPFIISGGWWQSPDGAAEAHREYHFTLTRRGELLWVYLDRTGTQRPRWMLHGIVE